MGKKEKNVWEQRPDEVGVHLARTFIPKYNTWVDLLADGAPKRRKRSRRRNPKTYRRFKKKSCEKCGFTSIGNPSLLSVHHKDHDRTNNDPTNLETLCIPCHQDHHRTEG